MPLGALGHRNRVKGLCTQAALGLRAAKGWGDSGSIAPCCPPAPFPQATQKSPPAKASFGHPQRDSPNPARRRAVTAEVHLPRRKPWVGSGEL